MIDMSTWKELVVDVVDDLHLDPRNVRLDLAEDAPESDLIQDLFYNEKALSLVDSIVKVGWLTYEVPIVVRRNRKLVVVEGNRRISALKAVQNPYLAPDFQARITKLTKNVDKDSLRRITVKQAPDQDDADQLVAAIHTGNQRVNWSPARQAAFFQAQVDAGKSADYLVARYPTVNVRGFIVRSLILNIFRNVNYVDPLLKDFVKHRSFPVSTLARLYENEDFLTLAKIKVNEPKVHVKLEGSRRNFAKVAEKIIHDIKIKKINTRVLNKVTADSYKDYMGELRDLVAEFTAGDEVDEDVDDASGGTQSNNPKQGNVGNSGANVANHATPPPASTGNSNTNDSSNGNVRVVKSPGKGQPNVKPVRPKKSNYLDASDIVIPAGFADSVTIILDEISRVNISSFPNAAMDLLRTFLEKLLKSYADTVGVDIRQHCSVSGYVFLSHCLQWIEEKFKNDGKRSVVQVVKQLRSGKISGYYRASTDHLNAINHNHNVYASPDDVRECWNTMRIVVKAVVQP